MLKIVKNTLALIGILSSLTACQTTPAEPKVQLTAEEVRVAFTNREWGWKKTTTHFNFGKDGSYTYKDSHSSLSGKYTISNDGILCAINSLEGKSPGLRTCYTFYKQGEKYVYYHDRSDKYYTAYLR